MRKWIETRLAELADRSDAKKNKSGLARHLNIQPSRITELIEGSREIKAREVRLLAEYLEWPEQRILDLDSTSGPLRRVPLGSIMVRGAVEAGAWQQAMEWPRDDWRTSPVGADKRFPEEKQYGLEVRGPSMNELYPEGTILSCVPILEYGSDPTAGQKVIVQRRSLDGFEATVKELRQDSQGQWWLWPRSNHPEFQAPWAIPKPADFDENDDIQIVAVVIGSYRPE